MGSDKPIVWYNVSYSQYEYGSLMANVSCAELKSNNVLMKMQVYELLSCLCMYSDEGYTDMGYHLSITALQHYKVITHCV